MAQPISRVPTINDLKVKLCYICREEESYDNPEDPPRAWTHPCKCTLIAHESCLLHWIQTSQADQNRAANALKCPQCGTIYELESNNPFVLRILDAGNKALSVLGRMVTATSLTTIVVSLGTGVYIMSTAYGAYALKQILGKEMFDLLLTEDPSAWPWHAFINLPLIPISLILSRLPLHSAVMPLVPILLAWPTSTPVASRERALLDQWRPQSKVYGFDGAPRDVWSTWPPSPAFVGLLLLPFARIFYRRCFARLSHWVLKTGPRRRPSVTRFMFALNAPFRIRFGANIEEVQPARPRQQEQQGGIVNANANVNGGAVPQLNGDDGNALVNAADHTIHITGSSLGRLVGGALIIPAISSFMGSILFRLSMNSPLLRRFLAIRPSMKQVPPALGPWSYPENWNKLSPVRQIGVAARLVLSVAWRGTRTWSECDPVWWRNAIGLGIFVAAKDCLHLLHLWYAKRELESRRVKNRSFEGVDIKELDLIDRTGIVATTVP